MGPHESRHSDGTRARCPVDPVAAFERAFRARVRAAREACGMTQEEMARRLEISRSAYSRCETRAPLPLHLIEEFARATGVEIKELFGVVEK